jgi:hypothetical protein
MKAFDDLPEPIREALRNSFTFFKTSEITALIERNVTVPQILRWIKQQEALVAEWDRKRLLT